MPSIAKIQFVPNYVTELRQQIGYYIGYVPNVYADQVTADDFYEIVRKDVEIARCLHLLGLMASGEFTEVECENEKLKNLCVFVLRQIRDFLHCRKSLVEKAVLFGLGIQRKYYRWVDYEGAKLYVAYRLAEVDRRRMRLERDQEDRTRIYWTMWCPKIDQYVILEDRSENPNAPEGLAVQDYIWYYQMQEELAPYWEGFGEVLYTLAYTKHYAIKYWADLCESWSKPFLVAQIDLMKAAVNASLGAGFSSAQQRIDKIIETFEACRARHLAVIDSSDRVQWFEHGSTGANIIRELIEYCDKKIQLLLLGAELSTTAAGVGSYALGAVHKAQTDTVVLYNRLRLAEVFTEDILFDFFYRNQSALAQLGIDFPRHGDVKIKIGVRQLSQTQEKGHLPMPQQPVGSELWRV